MKPLILTILVTVSAGSVTLAEPVAPRHGYHELSADFVPAPVRAAADSVFQVITFSPNVTNWVRLSRLERRRAFLMKSASRIDRLVIDEQIRQCREQGIDKCTLFLPVSMGTGYLLEDGQTLWTDYHVIKDFVSGLAQLFQRPEWIALLSLHRQPLKLALLNARGELVYLAGASERAQLMAKPYDGNDLSLLKGQYTPSSDLVKIQLSRSVGRPLPLAKQLPAVGESIYALGFPTGTGPYATQSHKELITRAPYPDSQGDRLYVSTGVRLATLDGINRSLAHLGQPPITEEVLRSQVFSFFESDTPNFSRLVYSELDVIFGNSGGPLLNADGEVFGMAGSVAVDIKDGVYRRTTTTSLDMTKAAHGPFMPTPQSETPR